MRADGSAGPSMHSDAVLEFPVENVTVDTTHRLGVMFMETVLPHVLTFRRWLQATRN